ncbi:hypothetical protein [Methylobacterium variabile]|uniref:hypothetical protein n=1 Tax=Methylobacterium variabile TaxID=298794 RepID=UPI0012ED280F|nr:hypothetical protein [Methylobacterium variabile]
MASGPDAPVLAGTGRRTPDKLFDAYVEFTKILLSNLFIINGGSAVALIALLGNIKEQSPVASLVNLDNAKDAIVIYGVGAFLAVIAAALTAWTENSNSSLLEESGRVSARFGVTAFIFIFMSGLCFLIGCLSAIDRLPWFMNGIHTLI